VSSIRKNLKTFSEKLRFFSSPGRISCQWE